MIICSVGYSNCSADQLFSNSDDQLSCSVVAKLIRC